jgi:hypothetical protein
METTASSSHNTVELDIERNGASHFRYPPINFRNRQIRLIHVPPADDGPDLVCDSQYAMLEDANVSYVVLSYAWSDAKLEPDVCSIRLGGQQFWIRTNL